MLGKTVSFCVQFLLLGLLGLAGFSVHGQTAIPQDSTKIPAKDSSQTAELEALKANSDLKSKIEYEATDYMILDLDGKTLKLVNTSKVDFEELTLNADTILMDWETNILTAKGKMDSTGQLVGRPEFQDGDQRYRSDSMNYNIQTQKGLVYGARTQQDENYILADKVKKEDGDVYYIHDGKVTTCDHEHPHYYIKSRKLKVLPKDKIITGPLMLVIEDFPLPVILPFGFFPNQTGKKSGIVMPTYGEAADRGFFLRDGGYYFAVSDQMDFMLRGDIFSKGGWRLEASTSYNKRYRMNGTLMLEYGKQKFGMPEDPSYRLTTDFWVRWNHRQTITPQANFTSNVNLGSSSYNQNYSYNEQDYLSNTFKSSITYQQSFANSPWRITAAADHSQNTNTEEITLGLPNVTVNRSRWFPFKPKDPQKSSAWYSKIGLNYSMNLKNQISVPDSLFDDVTLRITEPVALPTIVAEGDTTYEFKRALDYYQNGILHTVPITTQLNLAKYINISPNLQYREYWYIKTLEKTLDTTTNELVNEDIYGFAAARSFQFNLNASTRIYGMYQVKNSKRQVAFRHTLLPTLGYSYKPDFSEPFWGFYNTVAEDTLGNTQTYSRFSGGIFGGPSAGEIQSLNFGISNILEMKLLSKKAEKDTTIKDPFNKFNLLDNLGARGSYNFAADSLNLSFINLSARTNLFNNKLTLQITGNIDPYVVTAEGVRLNTYQATIGRTLGRLNDINFTFNTGFQSKNQGGVQVQSDPQNLGPVRPARLSDEEWEHIQYFRSNYVDFEVPWRLNLSYTLRYTNSGRSRDTTMTLNFNGDFNITPKLKIGYTSGYDFQEKDFSYTSVSIYRDLHCWEMSMTWIPFGARKSYNFSINVKSSTLRDLKLTKRNDWQDRF